jgi:hypothetical protein
VLFGLPDFTVIARSSGVLVFIIAWIYRGLKYNPEPES